MTKATTTKAKPSPVSDNDQEYEGIESNLRSALSSAISKEQFEQVRMIGAFITQGLTLEEACIMSQVDHSRLTSLMKSKKPVADYIELKQTTFKAKLLKQLSSQAFAGDPKLSAWLLERLYADQFNIKNKTSGLGSDTRDNLLAEGLRAIRASGDSKPLASQTALSEVGKGRGDEE